MQCGPSLHFLCGTVEIGQILALIEPPTCLIWGTDLSFQTHRRTTRSVEHIIVTSEWIARKKMRTPKHFCIASSNRMVTDTLSCKVGLPRAVKKVYNV